MQTISYAISPQLKISLDEIEKLREKILLTPLPFKTELRLRWEAMLGRIYWPLVLSGNPLSRREMVKLCIEQKPKAKSEKRKTEEEEVVKYKKALDYITWEWFVSNRPVSSKTILTLHDIACYGRLRIPEKDLKQLLDYLQASPEHPVIQAAIAQFQLEQMKPFTQGNGRVSRLLGLLFLYKAGLDFRGLLTLEEYFRHDQTGYTIATQSVANTGNTTVWLAYFVEAIRSQLEKALQDISANRTRLDVSATFFELNDRQKGILAALEDPDATMTNKKVQKMFHVSQITASRDLAKLANLGLLLPHGKGRSVYYTRV